MPNNLSKTINKPTFMAAFMTSGRRPKEVLVLVITLVMISSIAGCVEEPPKRDEIPHIKLQLSQLESFYRGEYNRPLDSLLTQRFYAEMGKKGQWEALVIEGVVWPFHGFANRSFYYTKNIAEVELKLRYRETESQVDSLLPVKIRLNYEDGRWLVENITPLAPVTY